MLLLGSDCYCLLTTQTPCVPAEHSVFAAVKSNVSRSVTLVAGWTERDGRDPTVSVSNCLATGLNQLPLTHDVYNDGQNHLCDLMA